MPPSPDAALFAALLAQRGPAEPAGPDGTALVLRLTDAVQEVTARLREASALVAEPRAAWTPSDLSRLGRLLEAAERASREQSACTTDLLRTVALPGLARVHA
ncbi:MAG: hypothetical protein MUF65_07090 [Rubritepida sp.]|nr:hypothetical protein [Rubritepida sp.]MCU0945117.1 hypothetical protein [Rubritepida sp.]